MECGLCLAQKENYRIVGENENAFSIIPIEPLKLGHLMVLPKKHIKNISEMSENELKSFSQLIDSLKKRIKELTNQDPILIINTGNHKSQEHLHLHIVPSKGNLRKLIANLEGVPERHLASKEEIEKMKEIIVNS